MRALTIAVASLFLLGGAHAATSKHLTPQQQKMAECSKENKGKKGDDYKKGVSDCMKGDASAAAPAAAPAAGTPPTQQQKMSWCAKANKGKKGADYKKAMSDCLAQ